MVTNHVYKTWTQNVDTNNKQTSNAWHLPRPPCSTAVWQRLPTSQNQFWLEVTVALRSRCQGNDCNWIQVLLLCFRVHLLPALWAQGDRQCRGREPSWHKCGSRGRGCLLCPDHWLARWCQSAALQRLQKTNLWVKWSDILWAFSG